MQKGKLESPEEDEKVLQYVDLACRQAKALHKYRFGAHPVSYSIYMNYTGCMKLRIGYTYGRELWFTFEGRLVTLVPPQSGTVPAELPYVVTSAVGEGITNHVQYYIPREIAEGVADGAI